MSDALWEAAPFIVVLLLILALAIAWFWINYIEGYAEPRDDEREEWDKRG